MKYLSNIDLVKNELQNAKIHILASDPGTPAEGQIYYNSTSKVLSFYNGTSFLYLGRLDQTSAPTASVSLNSQRITSLGTPSAATDAVTKAYADALVNGLTWKTSVRVATTVAGTLATSFENGDTIDDVVLDTGDRILLKNQATGSQNGIYIVAVSGSPTRATDMPASSNAQQVAMFVEEGTVNGDTQWVCTTDTDPVVGSDTLTFTQFGATAAVSDGDKGDIVVTGTGTIWSFDSAVVTTAAKTVLDDTTVAAMVDTLGGASSTGSTGLVRANAPTLVAPILGVASATSLATSAATPLLLTNGQLVNVALTSQTVGATTLTIPDFASVVDEFTFKTKSQTLSNKTFIAPILGAASATSLTLTNDLAIADGGTAASTAYDAFDNLTTRYAAGVTATAGGGGSLDLDNSQGYLTDILTGQGFDDIVLYDGGFRIVRFTATTTMTHGAGLVLPGAANITAVAGDMAIFVGYAANTVRCVSFSRLNLYTAYDDNTIHGADVASATTTNLDTATGFLVDVTGTTAITAITLANGRHRIVRFTGILTLTNGASLVLPGAVDITTAAGDFAIFVGYSGGVVRCVSYEPLGVVAPTRLGAGASIATKYLRGDSTWQTISGGGDALTSGTLAQFAATTSLELKNLITNETGSGALVFADTPTLVTPVLGVASATSLATSAATPLLLTNGQLVNVALTSQTVGATTLTIPDFASVVDEFTFKTKSQTLSNKTFIAPILGAASATSLTLTNDLAVSDGGTASSTAYTAYDTLSVHGADVASATTTNLETATGNLVDVTGTTAITAITLSDGHERTVRFTGALTLTNGASLVLPGGVNITTVAGDMAIFRGYAASVVRCVLYSPITVTGTGAAVKATTPTLVTPVLGVASATTVNKVTITEPASTATLTIPEGVVLTGPAASGTAMTLGNAETVTGIKTFGAAAAVGKLKVAGTTSGTTTIDATAAAGAGTVTLPLSGQIPAKYAVDIGDNSSTSIVVTHSLTTRDVVVSVHNATTYEQVHCDVEKTSTSTVTLVFTVAPTTNQYRAVVIG